MLPTTGAGRRAVNRIRQNPANFAIFQLQIAGITDTAEIARRAIAFSQELFANQPDVSEVERQARLRRAYIRRQQAQAVLRPGPPPIIGLPVPVAPPPLPPSPPSSPDEPIPDPIGNPMDLDQFLQWMNDHMNGIMEQNETWIINSGNTFYTLHFGNFWELYERITDLEYGMETLDAAESDGKILIEIIQNGEFTARLFVPRPTAVRVPRPDQNRGSFLPFTHIIDDTYVEKELAKYGLWREVKEENYTSNCLIQALEPSIDDEVVEDIKQAVRNASVPRKHLRVIGVKYKLLFVVHTDGDKNCPSFGDKNGQKIELCLYKGHYFPYVKDTGITGYALKHWKELKKKYPSNWYKKSGMGGQGGVGVSSMRLIKLMLDPTLNLSEPINLSNPEIWKTIFLNRVGKSFTQLEYPEEAAKLVHPARGQVENKRDFPKEVAGIKRIKHKLLSRPGGEEAINRIDKQIDQQKLGYVEQLKLLRSNMLPSAIIFFDFETSPEGKHEPYFVAWQVDGEDKVFNARGPSCAIEFLDWIHYFYGEEAIPVEDDRNPTEITLIAHNVSYDISFLLEHLEAGSMKAIKKGSKFVSASGCFGSLTLNFKDSYKIIPSPLRDFGKMFQLPYEKEVMPYDIYTHEFIQGDFLIHPDDIAKVCSASMVEEMRPNIEKHGCVSDDGERWDMLKYSKFYCERDVQVLNLGWNAFRKMALEFFDLDINASELLTTASMAFKHLQNECFDGVYSVSGIILEFIRQATFGGQTQSARNEPMIIEGEPILDMDKVSLYPTAMVTMPGIPLGKPKPFYHTIPSNTTYFFVQIHIHKVQGPEYDFPLLSLRTKEGINEWTNEIEDQTIVVGKQTLEDLVSWNDQIDYTVLRGYYWDEGWNPKLASTIQDMYDRRAELKSERNPAQLIFKLLMNSSYGRTGLKPISDIDYYLSPEKLNRFIANNYYRIAHMTIMPNGDTRVVANKAIDQHFNQQHVAAMILETSKHLMRKVLLLQQRIQTPLRGQIFYTDTDSIHISEPAWRELELIYKTKYEETLEGKNLGQFHSDFEMEGTFMMDEDTLVPTDLPESALQGGSLYSRKLIICGKKAYLDILTSTKNPDLELYHFRLKGVPETSIVSKCNKDFDGRIDRLYEALASGIKMTFTLSGLFKTGRDGLIKTTSMDRNVKFEKARYICL